MFRLLLMALLVFGTWKGYETYRAKEFSTSGAESPAPLAATSNPTAPVADFACDGRQYCSQMTSCKEATFFLKNCPDVKMDGNHDGVPCEQQWCR